MPDIFDLLSDRRMSKYHRRTICTELAYRWHDIRRHLQKIIAKISQMLRSQPDTLIRLE